MHRQNFNKHQIRCIFKNDICLTRSQLEELKKKASQFNIDENIQFTYSELREYLTDSYNRTIDIYKKVVQREDPKKPLDKIKEMIVSEGTKNNYITEWNRYSKWLKDNNKIAEKESADSYLASLTNVRASTLRQKQNMLQSILQHLINPSIKLNKIRQRISFIPKYPLTNEEIQEYLAEQKRKSFEDYLIQRFMISYGLRINSVALLKIKHLEFVTEEKPAIVIPDSKVKRFRVERINMELMDEFIKHLKEKHIPSKEEEYVFYREGVNESERKRAHYLCIRINNRIKNSMVLRRSKNYKYSSHMFRKTKAFNMFNREVENLKEKVRASIGQSQGSTAIESYIN